jgi:hypothetical protein
VQDRVRIYELDHTRGIAIRARSRKYKNNDAAIKQLVEDFDLLQNPTEDQIITNLYAIQYRLADKHFDDWDN